MAAMQSQDGKKQKMIAHKKANIMIEEVAKAILFLVLAIFVIIFLAKLFSVVKVIPEWSRSLSAIEKAIDNLNPDEIDITRTANVQLKGSYYIRGFAQTSGICIENEEKPHCICACSNAECTNAVDNKRKFCKSIKYVPSEDFIIRTETDNPLTYRIGLERSPGQVKVKLLGVTG